MKRLPLLILFFVAQNLFAQNWQPLGKGMNRFITVLYNDSVTDLLYAGGQFSMTDSLPIRGIAAWNGTKWDSLGGGMDNYYTSYPQNLFAICRYHDKIYVGGGFEKAGDVYTKYIATWDGQNWDSLNVRFNNVVENIIVYHDTLFVCGDFDSVGNIVANGVAMFDGNQWSDIGAFPNNFDNTFDVNQVYSMQFYNNDLYIVGNFRDASNNTQRISKWNHHQWMNVGNGIIGGNADPSCFAIYNNQLIVGGEFFQFQGNAGNNIQAWDGNQWYDLGGGLMSGRVWDLDTFQNKLWAVGVFTSAGGIPAQFIAYWDGQKWCGLGSNFDNVLDAIQFYHDSMFVAGGFENVDGDTLNCIAKWIGGSYVDTCGAIIGIKPIKPSSFDFSVFPNPSSSSITLSFSSINKLPDELIIQNMLGEVLRQEKISSSQKTIDVSNLPSGIYLLRVKTVTGEQSVKFVKE